jgi:hypothetical protein
MTAEPDPAATWIAAAGDRNEADIKRLALSDWQLSQMPHGDLRKALAALRRIHALAEQWHGERGNDYSASALFASKLREALREELLSEGESDG